MRQSLTELKYTGHCNYSKYNGLKTVLGSTSGVARKFCRVEQIQRVFSLPFPSPSPPSPFLPVLSIPFPSLFPLPRPPLFHSPFP